MEITKVFQFLNKKNSTYCIIEIDDNKKKLKNLQGEVDLVVENQLEYSALLDYLREEKWDTVYEFSDSGCKRIQLIKRDFLNGSFYKLDILNSFFHEKKNQFFILDKVFEGEFEVIENRNYLKGRTLYLIYLLKVLIEKKTDKVKKIVEFSEEDFFLRKDVAFLVQNNTTENLEEFLVKITKEGVVNKCKVSQKFIFFSKIKNLFQRYVFLKNIPMIGFVGLDGAGKSTIIANISDKLNEQDLSCKVVYLGHREYEIGHLKKIKDKKRSSIVDTLVYVLLWPIEVRIRVNKAIKTSNFILFDRHPYYEPVIPKGIKYFVLSILYKVLSKIFIPSPNFNFLLTGDNYILWSRKKENSFITYEKRVAELKKIVAKSKVKTITIKTDIALENSLMNIKEKIIEYVKNIT